MLPILRLAEIGRLCAWRASHGIEIDAAAVMAVAAHALADIEGMWLSGRRRHPGLDYITAREFLAKTGLSLTEAKVMHAVHTASNASADFRMNATLAGRLLELTRDERTGLGIVTIEAADEPAAERKARKRAEKLHRDRERAAERRRARGVKARKNAHEPQPWEIAGISRRAWFYRQAKARRQGCTNCTGKSQSSLYHRGRPSGATVIHIAPPTGAPAELRRHAQQERQPIQSARPPVPTRPSCRVMEASP